MSRIAKIADLRQVIAAKGEQKASGALRAAAETMEQVSSSTRIVLLLYWFDCRPRQLCSSGSSRLSAPSQVKLIFVLFAAISRLS